MSVFTETHNYINCLLSNKYTAKKRHNHQVFIRYFREMFAINLDTLAFRLKISSKKQKNITILTSLVFSQKGKKYS